LRNEAEKVRTLLIYLKCYTQGLFLSPDCVKYSVIYFVFPLRSEKHTVIINLHTTKWRHPFAAGPERGNYILVGLFIKPSHFSVCAVENAQQHCACAASSALQRARAVCCIDIASCAAFHHILGCVWQSLAARGALM